MSVKKTSVAIDEELLERARAVLQTGSMRDTIDAALREAIRAHARREEVRALLEMDGLDLADEDVMAGAWRT